jgi:hypothetical protein|tara:strand:- start:553 stop:813 length:261 start_codon:yes stop_codon:yes gene_type:complete
MDNIKYSQVLELTDNIAHELLIQYWKENNIAGDIYLEEPDFIIVYTDKAQDKFNELYDIVEDKILDAMDTYPKMNIRQIEEVITHT